MSKEIAVKQLSEIKPDAVRLEGWKKLLMSLWGFEVKKLNEVISDDPGDIPMVPANPTQDQIKEIISSIKKYEDLMAELKSKAATSVKERKVFTSKLDDVTKRLMVPEKTYETYVEKIRSGLYPLKKLEAAEAQKEAQKQREIAEFRQRTQIRFNNHVAETKTYIARKINEFYAEALSTVDIFDIDDYVEKLKSYPKFTPISDSFLDEEKQKISSEIWANFEPLSFQKIWDDTLQATFSGFEVAKFQREKALEDARIKLEAAEEDIKQDSVIDNQVAQLETKVEPTIIQTTKALKKEFVLDMPHTENSMFAVIRAFCANISGCLASFRGDDTWKIVAEMEKTLVSLKNKDEKFECDGIKFKQNERIV